jgi:AraC family transcriptional regulator
MNPVGNALWYIENHFAAQISLDEIAQASGVSRYYLSRAFDPNSGSGTIEIWIPLKT